MMFGSCRTPKLSCKCTLREHCGAPRRWFWGGLSDGFWQSHGMEQGDVGPPYGGGRASRVEPSRFHLGPCGDCARLAGEGEHRFGGPPRRAVRKGNSGTPEMGRMERGNSRAGGPLAVWKGESQDHQDPEMGTPRGATLQEPQQPGEREWGEEIPGTPKTLDFPKQDPSEEPQNANVGTWAVGAPRNPGTLQPQ